MLNAAVTDLNFIEMLRKHAKSYQTEGQKLLKPHSRGNISD